MATETRSDDADPLGLKLQGWLGAVVALRIRLFLSGVLFPIGCFLFTWKSPPTMNTPWQSGHPSDYVAMLLTWPGFAPFIPMVIFSQLCLTAWLVRPDSAKFLVVRLGIYGGFVLALQFLVFVMMVSAIMTFIFAAFIGPIMAMVVAGCVRLPRYAKRFTIRHLLITTTLIAILIAVMKLLAIPAYRYLTIVAGTGMYALMATPALCVLAYGRVAYTVAKKTRQATRLEAVIPSVIIWMLAWLASWKFAIDIMLAEYAKLPATDPNCYVSNAAAHGHQSIVRNDQRMISGQPVNMQMRRLKFLELSLKVALPRVHHGVRRCYDCIGPPLAATCQRSTWFADLTYLMLKPLEWLAESIRAVAGIRSSVIERIYRSV